MGRQRLTSIDTVTREFPEDVRKALANAPAETVADAGAAYTIPDVGVFHDITMTQNATLTFPTPTGDAFEFLLVLRGAFVPTFPASVDWPDGTPPTYTTPSVYRFITVDGGTTWLGAQLGKAFA